MLLLIIIILLIFLCFFVFYDSQRLDIRKYEKTEFDDMFDLHDIDSSIM